MPSFKDIAGQFAPSSGSGDFWSPEDGGDATRIRLYRVMKDGEPQLFPYVEEVVWTGSAYSPDTPELKQTRERLYASGTKEDRQKANALKPRKKAWLSIVLPDTPTGFRIWKAPQSLIQRILCICAQAASGGMPQKFKDTPEFYEKAEAGSALICGPEGQDLALSFDKAAGPSAMYDLQLLNRPPQGFATLPFSEDEAPDPEETAKRIAEAKANKG